MMITSFSTEIMLFVRLNDVSTVSAGLIIIIDMHNPLPSPLIKAYTMCIKHQFHLQCNKYFAMAVKTKLHVYNVHVHVF